MLRCKPHNLSSQAVREGRDRFEALQVLFCWTGWLFRDAARGVSGSMLFWLSVANHPPYSPRSRATASSHHPSPRMSVSRNGNLPASFTEQTS